MAEREKDGQLSIPVDNSGLTEDENKRLNLSLANLRPIQIKAAILEAGGMNRTMIAEQLSVNPESITSWRSNEHYKNIVTINSVMLDRQSRSFRIKQLKQILAPAYAELIRRMADPLERQAMDTKDILAIVSQVAKEVRTDLTYNNENEDHDTNELKELQSRRNKVIAMQQNQAIDDLEKDGKIIQLPFKKAVNS